MSEKELWYIMCNCDDIIKAENEDEAYMIFCKKHNFKEKDAEFVSYGRINDEKEFIGLDDGLDFSIKHIESGEIFYDCESVVDLLNELAEENRMLKEHQNINCQNCQYFVSGSASSDCLKREDIGYKGTCIDGMDLHKLAKNCPYY